MFGIELWIWILIFCAIGCALINPILYFIYWKIYIRSEWIENRHSVNEIQPRVKDVWDEFIAEYGASWWIPGINYFISTFLILFLIFRPTKAFWQKVVKWFGNIKV